MVPLGVWVRPAPVSREISYILDLYSIELVYTLRGLLKVLARLPVISYLYLILARNILHILHDP